MCQMKSLGHLHHRGLVQGSSASSIEVHNPYIQTYVGMILRGYTDHPSEY